MSAKAVLLDAIEHDRAAAHAFGLELSRELDGLPGGLALGAGHDDERRAGVAEQRRDGARALAESVDHPA